MAAPQPPQQPAASTPASSSTHRLPTQTASQALLASRSRATHLTTALPSLSLPRGQLLSISGPPGIGKTAFSLSLASCALSSHYTVLWLDTGSPLPPSRLPRAPHTIANLYCPTILHLLAFCAQPQLPARLGLVVVEDLHALFARREHREKKWQICAQVVEGLNRIAGAAGAAVVVTMGIVGSAGGRALKPAVSAEAWEKGVQNRWWLERGRRGERRLKVEKREGRGLAAGEQRWVGFEIGEGGCVAGVDDYGIDDGEEEAVEIWEEVQRSMDGGLLGTAASTPTLSGSPPVDAAREATPSDTAREPTPVPPPDPPQPPTATPVMLPSSSVGAAQTEAEAPTPTPAPRKRKRDVIPDSEGEDEYEYDGLDWGDDGLGWGDEGLGEIGERGWERGESRESRERSGWEGAEGG